MRSEKFDLKNLYVASACPMSWNQMKGDDRTRHCSLCELNVHNIAGLSAGEVGNLVATSEGRLCVRLFRRADGTVITRDCPVGLRKYRMRVAGIASAGFAAVLSFFSISYSQKGDDAKKIDASKIEIGRSIEKIGSSSVHGSITDSNGGVVPGVEVRVFQNGKKAAPMVVSDAEGRFSFVGLREGIYEVGTSRALGFRALLVKNLELKANEIQELTLVLEVDSSVEQLIGVVAVAPMIDLTTAEQTTVFTRDMIDRIPGRRPFD